MKLKTKNFGEIEIDESKIIHFEDGIPGFEHLKNFLIIKDEELIIDYLQAIEEDVTFPIINPFSVNKEYEFKIPDNAIKKLKIENTQDLSVYTIVTIPENIKEMRTNLQAPIIINNKNKKGKQLILDERYPLRYMIFEKVGA
ncbi:flagellar assembly protein FliW [Tepidibacter formicigenes]|uniref:Flagellar assembly factor FliW n=1 Tax=Tepidibacter formicigenes DSM 15518 TaxID=1123349 RepID=A0A1M6P0V6_9FIRM|nr:flagellar assembly protein FliW [Tepidibacter formicigenes]SHK01523.1 flagellar assembly factor FliW [Tepidibacter formicigenes DSM 15518]